MSLMDKIIAARTGGNGPSLPDDDEARTRYPTLWAFLTRTDAGQDRLMEPGRLSISLGLGEWMVEITHADLLIGLATCAETLAGAFEALERRMQDPHAPWRAWKGKDVNLREKKKKRQD